MWICNDLLSVGRLSASPHDGARILPPEMVIHCIERGLPRGGTFCSLFD